MRILKKMRRPAPDDCALATSRLVAIIARPKAELSPYAIPDAPLKPTVRSRLFWAPEDLRLEAAGD
jgi:hypothetical protein